MAARRFPAALRLLRGSDTQQPAPPNRPRKRTPEPTKSFDGPALAERFARQLTDPHLTTLAADLKVTRASLRSIGVGWASRADLKTMGAWGKDWDKRYPEGAFTFPERSASGTVTSFSLRTTDGRKGSPKNAGRGLIVPTDFAVRAGTVFVVEGASDVAACETMGLLAIGRPSNSGGADDLADLLRHRHDVMIVGENDEKPDGSWPGKTGMLAVATSVAKEWNRGVRYGRPPIGVKDVREWLKSKVADGLDLRDAEACKATGREFLSQLEGLADSIPAPIESDLAGIEFNPVPITELGDCQPPEWIWHGYIARGFITLLSAVWKSGKTTLVSHLLRDIARGAGLACCPADTKILVVSEENSRLWIQRREKLGLGVNVHLQCQPSLSRMTLAQWTALTRRIAELAKSEGYAAVVFDTLPSLWCVKDENNASEVGDAVMPIRAITGAGAAVVFINHTKKGDSVFGQGSRGSGALPAAADFIIEMHESSPGKVTDRKRILYARSRFDETPPESVLELTDAGYVVIGDKAEMQGHERIAFIQSVLPATEPGLTAEEVHERWTLGVKIGIKTVRDDLHDGAAEKRWSTCGKGVKGDPKRYFLNGHFDSGTTAPLGAGMESKPGRKRTRPKLGTKSDGGVN